MKILRYAWLIVTGMLACYVLIAYVPSYSNNEFPLFTDLFLTFVYLPCLFILCAAIPSQITILSDLPLAKRVQLSLIIHLLVSIVVIIIMPTSLWLQCILLFLGLAASAIYISITSLIFFTIGRKGSE